MTFFKLAQLLIAVGCFSGGIQKSFASGSHLPRADLRVFVGNYRAVEPIGKYCSPTLNLSLVDAQTLMGRSADSLDNSNPEFFWPQIDGKKYQSGTGPFAVEYEKSISAHAAAGDDRVTLYQQTCSGLIVKNCSKFHPESLLQLKSGELTWQRYVTSEPVCRYRAER